ncbi:alcohol dehydrogenase catalytic domain-containing protein [uncultured Jatrophihabitans sp.]|uniref:alcohol dehydrogenase catalytic domain-containing protein n=1 Tax=uncultured Jatrophihabitans sp. TaxID=1610747 RepID=UPI0035CAB315
MAQVAPPQPASNRLLVQVQAVGLCGTDLKIIDGLLGEPPSLPLILGHEIAGVVVDGDDRLASGTRVAVRGLQPCGRCHRCDRGLVTVCTSAAHLGFDLPGGLASVVSVASSSAMPIPDTLGMAEAAVTMDAVSTTWRALRTRASVAEGETVVVCGAGGLGNSAIQIARCAGARVAAIDPSPAQRDAAVLVGADLAVAPADAAHLLDWAADSGIDVGVECSGTQRGFDTLSDLVSPGARIVCNGYRPGVDYGMDSGRLVLDEISILGSRNCTPAEASAALVAVADGRIRPFVSRTIDLDDVNDAIDLLRQGVVVGRIVLTP